MIYSISYEELYLQFGKLDLFVRLKFNPNSDADSDFGNSIMGEFNYTLKEREQLEIMMKGEITSTNKYVRFKPSPLDNLTDEQIEKLDRKGLLSGDIINISYSTYPSTKAFKSEDTKKLNKIEIPFNGIDFPINKANLFLLNDKIKNRIPLIKEEMNEYFGLQLYFENDIREENKRHVFNDDMKTIKDEILYYLYKAKFIDNKFPKNEMEEMVRIHIARIIARLKILNHELKLATGNQKGVYKNYTKQYECMLDLLFDFNTEVILNGKKPIWWDFERFAHIYIRHVKETRIGENNDSKTLFQYELGEVKSVIQKVVEGFYSDILEHFEKNPEKPFFRQNIRSEYFNGIYYRVEIEPTGRLLTFHPYNNSAV